MIKLCMLSCFVCGAPLKITDHNLCSACRRQCKSDLHYCSVCTRPVLQNSGNTLPLCGNCISHHAKRAINQVVCVSEYDGVVQWLITQFKYRRNIALSKDLAEMMLSRVSCLANSMPEALIPMPLHWSRRFQRGFNQAELLALHLSERLDIPVINKGIKRVKKTPALEQHNRKERRKIMNGVFQIQIKLPEHVCVIDDVFTTGASTESLIRSLKRCGAKKVDLWVMARTPLK